MFYMPLSGPLIRLLESLLLGKRNETMYQNLFYWNNHAGMQRRNTVGVCQNADGSNWQDSGSAGVASARGFLGAKYHGNNL